MVVWSLFDGSGIMGLPWAQAGHDVFCFNFDGVNHGEYEVKMNHEKIHYVNVWIDNSFNLFCIKHGIPSPNIIFAFPDCTMFAHSGAQHKRIYGEVNQALDMAKLTESLGVSIAFRGWLKIRSVNSQRYGASQITTSTRLNMADICQVLSLRYTQKCL